MELMEETGLAGLTSTDSISKGVFAFKRGNKRNANTKSTTKNGAKKRRTKRLQRQLDLESNKIELFGTSKSAKMRQEIYDSTWQTVSNKMKSLQKDVFDKVLLDIIKFTCDESLLLNDDVLPTCALVTGVNLPDHEDLFKLIKKTMRQKVTDHVAMVKSSECGTLKILMKKVISQLYLTDSYDSDDDEDDIDEEDTKESVTKSTKFVPTMGNLVSWYSNQYCQKKPPLVIVLEDFEGFPSQVLQDLIANLNENRSSLPFILVFGIATTVEAIHRLLPHGTTSKLAIESFASAPSIHLLSKFLESIVFDSNIPFYLGGHALKLLLERFSFHDFSVRHFLMGLKICMLEHFSTNESSVLCCPKSRRIEALEKIAKNSKMKDNLEQLDEKIVLFNAFVSCLHNLVSNLPRQPLGKNFHHVYNTALLEPITESQEYRESFQYLKLSEKNGLTEILNSFISSLNAFLNYSDVEKVVTEAKSLIEELTNVGNVVKLQRSESAPVTPSSSEKNTLKTEKTVKMDRFKLQEALLEQVREKKLNSKNPFEVLRDKIMDFLHHTFKKFLGTLPSTWEFSKIFYFDDVKILKQRIVGAPRNVAQMSLKFPWNYLQVDNLKIENDDDIPGHFPDVCIAYKLHLECGKLINLYDWLICWLQIVGNSEENETEDGIVDPRLHARFSRAVSELQFLGFIKPSKRKTDHVERLTF